MSDEETRAKGIQSRWLGRAMYWLWSVLRPRRFAQMTRSWAPAPWRPADESRIPDHYLAQTQLYREPEILIAVDPAVPEGTAIVTPTEWGYRVRDIDPADTMDADWRRGLQEVLEQHQRYFPEYHPPRAQVTITPVEKEDPDV